MSDNHKVVVFANNNPSTAESNDFSFGNDNDSASGETSGSTGNASSEMNNSNGGYVTSGLAKEERWVSMARALVFAVMVTAATIVGVETFRISTNQQLDNFINDYYTTAEEILEESEIRTANAFASIYTMSQTVTTLVTSVPSLEWPFVAHLPHFETWAGGINLELTGALSLSYSVLVHQGQEQQWSDHYVNGGDSNVTAMTSQGGHYHGHDEFDEDVTPYIWRYGGDGAHHQKVQVTSPVFDEWSDEYAVLTQRIPHKASMINHDEYESSIMASLIEAMKHDQQGVMSDMFASNVDDIDEDSDDLEEEFEGGGTGYRFSSFFLQPIYAELLEDKFEADDHHDEAFEVDEGEEEVKPERTMVGYLKAELPWDHYFLDLLPEDAKGIQVVVSTECNGIVQAVTYELVASAVILLGEGDRHDPTHEDMVVEELFNPMKVFSEGGLESSDEGGLAESAEEEDEEDETDSSTSGCAYTIRIYPSDVYRQQYKNNRPAVYTALGVIVILTTAMVFMVYDWFVKQRQRKMMATANRTNAIVNSLFPSTVRDRLFDNKPVGDGQFDSELGANTNNFRRFRQPFTSKGTEKIVPKDLNIRPSRPIADLFASATVMFADFCGFTAWSSVREPSQVFVLLEAVYDAFDKIAKRRGIFKVETIGDCYVAAAGLPTPRDDHAEIMSRFATECKYKMINVVQSLEVLLGPGTEELGMRFGLHSGQVMAGVLRGEKSRFQLFGDTVNTASRIETTGAKNKIHISSQTADLLIAANKTNWIKPRATKVVAKGKGELQTYWLVTQAIHPNRKTSLGQDVGIDKVNHGSDSFEEAYPIPSSNKAVHQDKMKRLVDYNTEVLLKLLKKMVAMRYSKSKPTGKRKPSQGLRIQKKASQNVLDEVKEIITLPSEPAKYLQDPESAILPDEVVAQLRDYVKTIASMYHNNSFHSFEHASHVTMSVTKLLSRVVTSDSIDYTNMTYTQPNKGVAEQHQFTYGITSDPLTQFAVAFSALIHDVDHPGVPNATLVNERAEIARMYNNQSVAEQNSVDLAWSLLMEPAYDDLRMHIYSTQTEMDRFRQLIVNSVMATDICDKDLGALRKARWAKAFDAPSSSQTTETEDDINRKATIVIEHLIQASDVAHTMQHWHVYLKWNKKLFMEMYAAYKAGRSDTDPSLNWYNGELGFFDFYLIPLAKKLEECGVFGVSSDEYLAYATANRREWELKGRDVVKGYVEEATRTASPSPTGSSVSGSE